MEADYNDPRTRLARGQYVYFYRTLLEKYATREDRDREQHARDVAEQMLTRLYGKELSHQIRKDYHDGRQV